MAFHPLKRIYSYFLFILFTLHLLLAGASATSAQNRDAQANNPDSTNYVVRRLSFEGNDSVSSATLEALIRTQTNREFLGISGFTPWYYIWKLTDSFGEKPAYLNYQTVATDLQRLTQYYNSVGYLEATADSSITIYDQQKARVKFIIDEGKRAQIQSVSYTGMPDSAFTDSTAKVNFYKSSSLTETQINDSTFKSIRPYKVNELDLERGRIIDHLKNNGYAAVQRDSITALVKRKDNDDYALDVLYVVNPGKKYTFGDLYMKLAGPGIETDSTYQMSDTLQGDPHTLNSKKIYLWKEEAAQSRFSLLTDQILFKPGDTFNYERYIRSVNEFQNLGMMSIRQFGLSEDGSGANYANDDEIPVYFSLQTLPKHSINVNVFGLRRYGYGSGAGITYSNNNLFGKAENLQINVNGSFEYVGQSQLDNLPFLDSASAESDSRFFRSFETRADYSLPRLTFPFASLDENLFFANSRTRYSLSYSQSDQLLFDINYNVGFNQRFEVKHNDRLTSFLDLLNLELLDANPSNQFVDALCNEYGDENDSNICPRTDPDDLDNDNNLALEQILEDFRPQFSSTLRYAFRSQRTDLIKRNYGYFSEYSVSLGGNIPFLIDRFFVTPGTVEGTLPSPGKVSDSDLAYSRFVKTTADYRRYLPLGTNTVFAFRGYGGYARPYGESRTIPLNQRFYAGGSNDVRGWALFELGPGGIPQDQVSVNGGEVKLLAQTELRQTAFKNLLASKWILALFADAGNIWYGSKDKIDDFSAINGSEQNSTNLNLERGKFKFDQFYNQIAVGSGLGLRLDFDYLVARVDFAFRIHDLQDGWFQDGKPFFHFGIGHSF